MTIRSRVGALCLGLVMTTALTALPLSAQETAETKKGAPPATGKSPSTYRRVPIYFGQVGLSTEQRERIYTIRGTHQEKIVALKQQIEDIESQELAECEAVLTESQKKLLDQRRTDSKARSRSKKGG